AVPFVFRRCCRGDSNRTAKAKRFAARSHRRCTGVAKRYPAVNTIAGPPILPSRSADMRRALIVSPHFPPDSSAASHRMRLLAPHLAEAGWTPTVVAVEPDAYEGRLDPDLAAMVPDSLEVVRAPAWRAGWTRRVGIGDLGLR